MHQLQMQNTAEYISVHFIYFINVFFPLVFSIVLRQLTVSNGTRRESEECMFFGIKRHIIGSKHSTAIRYH